MSNSIEFRPKRCGIIYFEKIELVMMLVSIILSSMPAFLLYLFGLYSELGVFMVFAGLFCGAFMLSPLRRARFIRSGGIYRMNPSQIEWIWPSGNVEKYSIHHMKCTVRKRFNRADVLFGKNLIDYIKHFGSRESQGVGLYSVELEQLPYLMKIIQVQRGRIIKS